MTELSSLQAYDLLRYADGFAAKLREINAGLAQRGGPERARHWLSEAEALIEEHREELTRALAEVRVLPELEEVRLEIADEQQEKWVDALERLLAGITFHSNARDPVIEAIFPHQKFPALRRATREAVAHYAAEFDRRRNSSYVKRIFGQDAYAFVGPVVEQIQQELAAWKACFEPEPISEERASELRTALFEVSGRIDFAIQQAKLLAQAALLPTEGQFESSGLAGKPKKRVGKVTVSSEVDTNGLLSERVVIDDGPTPEEWAELRGDVAASPYEQDREADASVEPAAEHSGLEAISEAAGSSRAETPVAAESPEAHSPAAEESSSADSAAAEAAPAAEASSRADSSAMEASLSEPPSTPEATGSKETVPDEAAAAEPPQAPPSRHASAKGRRRRAEPSKG